MNRQIISYNMAGWNWRISTEKWEDRVRRSCEYIINKMSEPMVIGLQEVQLSGGKYLKVLEEYFPEYHIILPPAFNGQPRSVISILLLRKDICDSYSVNVLDNLEDSLRYNYVTFNTSDGLCFRVLNTNIPHVFIMILLNYVRRTSGCMPRFAEYNEVGTVKDFENTGYSFVAKKNNEVVGVIMVQKIMDYGSYYIFVNNYAVKASVQGMGIGKQLLEHLISVSKEDKVHKIMLHTEKSLKAYDIYHHMGFGDQDDESVYLTKWFM